MSIGDSQFQADFKSIVQRDDSLSYKTVDKETGKLKNDSWSLKAILNRLFKVKPSDEHIHKLTVDLLKHKSRTDQKDLKHVTEDNTWNNAHPSTHKTMSEAVKKFKTMHQETTEQTKENQANSEIKKNVFIAGHGKLSSFLEKREKNKIIDQIMTVSTNKTIGNIREQLIRNPDKTLPIPQAHLVQSVKTAIVNGAINNNINTQLDNMLSLEKEQAYATDHLIHNNKQHPEIQNLESRINELKEFFRSEKGQALTKQIKGERKLEQSPNEILINEQTEQTNKKLEKHIAPLKEFLQSKYLDELAAITSFSENKLREELVQELEKDPQDQNFTQYNDTIKASVEFNKELKKYEPENNKNVLNFVFKDIMKSTAPKDLPKAFNEATKEMQNVQEKMKEMAKQQQKKPVIEENIEKKAVEKSNLKLNQKREQQQIQQAVDKFIEKELLNDDGTLNETKLLNTLKQDKKGTINTKIGEHNNVTINKFLLQSYAEHKQGNPIPRELREEFQNKIMQKMKEQKKAPQANIDRAMKKTTLKEPIIEREDDYYMDEDDLMPTEEELKTTANELKEMEAHKKKVEETDIKEEKIR